MNRESRIEVYNADPRCNVLTIHAADHTSGLVFGSPITLFVSFHCPRFLSRSTRSKRFKTLRLAAMVLAPLRLRCCDMGEGGS